MRAGAIAMGWLIGATGSLFGLWLLVEPFLTTDHPAEELSRTGPSAVLLVLLSIGAAFGLNLLANMDARLEEIARKGS